MEESHAIARYLQTRGETQAAFAQRVGISAPHLSNIISGRDGCGAEAARKIVGASGGALRFEDLLAVES